MTAVRRTLAVYGLVLGYGLALLGVLIYAGILLFVVWYLVMLGGVLVHLFMGWPVPTVGELSRAILGLFPRMLWMALVLAVPLGLAWVFDRYNALRAKRNTRNNT